MPHPIEPCPCGSFKLYKDCCGKAPTSSRVVRLAYIESYLPAIAPTREVDSSSSPDALPARNRLKFWLSEDITSDTLPTSSILPKCMKAT
jgi:hypothetical protein